MAKNTIPNLRGGTSKAKAIFGIALFVLLVLIVSAPVETATFLKSAGGNVGIALDSVATFFRSL